MTAFLTVVSILSIGVLLAISMALGYREGCMSEAMQGECYVESFDDGLDEGLDGEWYTHMPPTWYLSCGHEAHWDDPLFCPVCGKRVVPEPLFDEEDDE